MYLQERWHTITNFKKVQNNMYQVSDHGNVRDLLTGQNLPIRIKNIRGHKYMVVYLSLNDGTKDRILVHQLVATFFCKVPDKYKGTNLELVPDHLDNNGMNNHYTNLEWKTRGENVKAAFIRKEVDKSGEKNHGSLITDKQADQICQCLMDGLNYDSIIEIMNFPNTQQYRRLLIRIKNGLAYTNVSEKYDLKSLGYQYNDSCNEAVKNIARIRLLHNEGYSNGDIVKEIWGNDISKAQYNNRMVMVRGIIKNRTYTDIR